MTTQTDLSAEEPAERAATGAQTAPVAQAGMEATDPLAAPAEATGAIESAGSVAQAATPAPEIAIGTELVPAASTDAAPVGETRDVTYTNLPAQEDPTQRAIASSRLLFKVTGRFKATGPGGTCIEGDATVEVPSGSPIETALAKFIDRFGLPALLAFLTAIVLVALIVTGVNAWLIATLTGGILALAVIIIFTRKRSTGD